MQNYINKYSVYQEIKGYDSVSFIGLIFICTQLLHRPTLITSLIVTSEGEVASSNDVIEDANLIRQLDNWR